MDLFVPKCTLICWHVLISLQLTSTITMISNFDFRNKTDIIIQGATVALCMWIEDVLDCDTASGYEFHNHTLTDELVIKVPHASRDQSGRYACLVLGSASEAFTSCNFVVMTGNPSV